MNNPTLSAKDEIKAFIFDVFGTVVDWRTGVATECEKAFLAKNITFDPYHFADMWRGEYQPAMERIRSGNRGYVPLDILHRENLEIVGDKTGLSDAFTENELSDLNHAWEKLPPWEDSVAGLTKIAENFLIAPCSNGSIALMARLAKFGGLPWHAIVGADIAKAYKPTPVSYLRSCEALGLLPSEVVMVAAHNTDLVAASAAGLKTAFFPRKLEHGDNQETDLEASDQWTFIAENLLDLANQVKSKAV